MLVVYYKNMDSEKNIIFTLKKGNQLEYRKQKRKHSFISTESDRSD